MPSRDSQMVGEPREFVLEELRLPELGRRIRQMRALSATELVVENAGAPEPAQFRDRLNVVMCGARPAVADHDRRLLRAGIEIAEDAVPRLVSFPCHPSLVRAHLTLLLLSALAALGSRAAPHRPAG